MFAIAGAVLLAIAGIIFLGGLSGVSAPGLACIGGACLCVHLAWPLTPWRRTPPP